LLLDEHRPTPVGFVGGFGGCNRGTPAGTDLPLAPTGMAEPGTSRSEGLILPLDHLASGVYFRVTLERE